MVWLSTRASIQAQQVSFLALIETMIAIALAVLFFVYTGSLVHIAVGSALAPFLLLQTPTSNRQSLRFVAIASRIAMGAMERLMPVRLFEKTTKTLDPEKRFWTALGVVLLAESYIVILSISLYLLMIASCIVAKPIIVLVNFLRTPLTTASFIPENWRKVVLSTDSAMVPELVPGLDDHPGANAFLPLSIRAVLYDTPNITKTGQIVGFVLLGPFLYLPAISYRWSLKATAIIWSPLLWAFRPLARHDDPLHFAKEIIRLTKYRIARGYSAVIFLAFTLKLAVLLTWAQLEPTSKLIPKWDVIAQYLSPETIPLWHLAAVTNASLTWFVFFRAERYLHEAEGPAPIPLPTIRTYFRSRFIIRNLVTIYIMICTVYLTFEIAGLLRLPALRVIIFPWN